MSELPERSRVTAPGEVSTIPLTAESKLLLIISSQRDTRMGAPIWECDMIAGAQFYERCAAGILTPRLTYGGFVNGHRVSRGSRLRPPGTR